VRHGETDHRHSLPKKKKKENAASMKASQNRSAQRKGRGKGRNQTRYGNISMVQKEQMTSQTEKKDIGVGRLQQRGARRTKQEGKRGEGRRIRKKNSAQDTERKEDQGHA